MRLRDDLADKLSDVACEAASGSACIEWDTNVAHALADECIRQMRWAECCNSSPDGGPPPYVCARIAPERWVPPDYEVYDMGPKCA